MKKAGKAAETVKHIINIVDRTVNFGIKTNLLTPDKKILRSKAENR